MKFAVVALALVMATPTVVAFSSPADAAQVLAGRGGDTRRSRSAAPRPALSEREEERLFAAEDAVIELTEQIEAIEASPVPAQTDAARIEELRRRLNDEQRTVDRLVAKRDR